MSLEKRLKDCIHEAVTAVKIAEKAALDTSLDGKLDIVRDLIAVENQLEGISARVAIPTFKVMEETDLRALYDEGLIDFRALNVCKRASCSTVGDLCSHTDEEIMRFRNMGKKSFEMLKEALNKAGFETKTANAEQAGGEI